MEDRIKMKQNISDDKGHLQNIILYPDHIYKHFINVCGKCGHKASIFNKGEDIKLEIAKKQFNVLKGEDEDDEYFNCPYKDFFRVALRWINPEERHHILEITNGEELVQEMIDEIREDELEEEEFDNRTREPESENEYDDKNDDKKDEDEEDDEEEEKDDFDDEYKEQFKNMTDEQIEHHIGLEKVRNVMEGYDREHGIDKIRKMISNMKKTK